jgi:hypothetical protein
MKVTHRGNAYCVLEGCRHVISFLPTEQAGRTRRYGTLPELTVAVRLQYGTERPHTADRFNSSQIPRVKVSHLPMAGHWVNSWSLSGRLQRAEKGLLGSLNDVLRRRQAERHR